VRDWLLVHLDDHYGLYGEASGVRSARKHIGWTVETLPGGPAFRAKMNRLETCAEQVAAVAEWFDELGDRSRLLPQANAATAPESMLQ
jgi:tRNA-dihydrouridine synthase B